MWCGARPLMKDAHGLWRPRGRPNVELAPGIGASVEMRHGLRRVRVLDSLKDAMTVYGNSGGERGDQMWVGREALKTLATKGPRSMEEIEEYLSNAATSNGFGWLGEWQGGPLEWVLDKKRTSSTSFCQVDKWMNGQ